MLRYAITDRMRLGTSEPARREALLNLVRHSATAHVDFVQLREKDLGPRELVEIARSILPALHGQPPPRPKLLINSRADVAIACRAEGVHLTSSEGELTPEQVIKLYAAACLPAPVVSISCHSLAEVIHARALVPSLILFGPVFEKVVSDPATEHTAEALIARGTGVNLLRAVCTAAAPIPVLALGGVTDANTPDCLEAGAAGVAAIRLFSNLAGCGAQPIDPLFTQAARGYT